MRWYLYLNKNKFNKENRLESTGTSGQIKMGTYMEVIDPMQRKT